MSYYSYDRSSSRGALIAWAIAGIVVLGIIGYLGWLWGWNVYVVRALFVTGGGQLIGMIILSILVILGIGIWAAVMERGWLVTFPILAAAIIWILVGFNSAYATQNLYLPSTNVSNGTIDRNFDQRVPFDIASAQVDKNMGDSVGNATSLKSIASEGEFGLWNSLVIRRGFAVGYEGVISIDSPTYGNVTSEDVERCYFDEQKANMRLGGFLPQNDLGREILNRLYWSNVTLDPEDTYGYCLDGTPHVVLPLVSNEGFIFQKRVPWGVALYNGSTGELTITQDADEIAKVPGPTYPITVASAQRNSLQSYNGDYWEHFQGLLGWDTVGNTEIQLRETDSGVAEYFTALQPRGASSSVVAAASVDSRMLEPGKFNQLEVVKLPQERAASATISDTIKNQYSYMPEFAGSNYQVYEIVPGVDQGWVASVGTDQSVVYRVLIDVTGSKLELIDRNGNTVGGKVTTGEDGEPTGVTLEGSIEDMSEAELLVLLGQISDRLTELNSAE